MRSANPMPVPEFFDADAVGKLWGVPYQVRAQAAEEWRQAHKVEASSEDSLRVCLLLVDVQNTFCLPDFELFVAGNSGTGAVEDNQRLCRFIYRNLNQITTICPTMDSHQAIQIFHSIFLIDKDGNHPAPLTQISEEDLRAGRWQLNPQVGDALGLSPDYVQRHCLHYTEQLSKSDKFSWTIWPYHAMLGGVGHALVSAVEEAVFFHSICRVSPVYFEVKGRHPLTEHYSVLGPEVVTGPDGEDLKGFDSSFRTLLAEFDRIVIAGQAKSHCVSWTISDMLAQDLKPGRIYLLEDCTSPVVVEDSVDFSEEADRAFEQFEEAGAHRVVSSEKLADWPGFLDA